MAEIPIPVSDEVVRTLVHALCILEGDGRDYHVANVMARDEFREHYRTCLGAAIGAYFVDLERETDRNVEALMHEPNNSRK